MCHSLHNLPSTSLVLKIYFQENNIDIVLEYNFQIFTWYIYILIVSLLIAWIGWYKIQKFYFLVLNLS